MAKQVICFEDGTPVENEHYRWVINSFPKFEGHTMVIPKRHVTELGTESPEEGAARDILFKIASESLRSLYPGAGVEVFAQLGEGSEASVAHIHWHIVPAQPGDPLRSFDKLGHFYSVTPKKEKIIIFPIKILRARSTLQRALRKHTKRKEDHAAPEGYRHGRR